MLVLCRDGVERCSTPTTANPLAGCLNGGKLFEGVVVGGHGKRQLGAIQVFGQALLPDSANAVGIKDDFIRDDGNALCLSLGNQHAVKGILVRTGQ